VEAAYLGTRTYASIGASRAGLPTSASAHPYQPAGWWATMANGVWRTLMLSACAAAFHPHSTAEGDALLGGRLPTFVHEGRETNGLVYENGEVVHIRGNPIDHTHWETPGRFMTHHKAMKEMLGSVSACSQHRPQRSLAPGRRGCSALY
jgi:hypothetical protein